jgi:hypothetical protein
MVDDMDLMFAHTFFVDVVGLADPVMPVKNQVKKMDILYKFLRSCKTFKETPRKSRLILPTGDGMSINFLRGPEKPLNLAIELHRKLNVYNKAKVPDEMVAVRIGLNQGSVYVTKDIEGKPTVWGPGIILARRVMDLGDKQHILVAGDTAEALHALDIDYKMIIRPLGWCSIKHNQRIKVYNAYGNGFGNPDRPSKPVLEPFDGPEPEPNRDRDLIDKEIDVSLTILDPKTLLTRHRHLHKVIVTSDKPVDTILHGISTDVKKSFSDLNLRMYDEEGKELRISEIRHDAPYQKEFTISLNRPIYKDERGRSYLIEYEVEEPERYFQHLFPNKCDRFSMSLIYPAESKFKPVIYNVKIDPTRDKMTRSDVQPSIGPFRNGLFRVRWRKKNVLSGQAFRLKW